MMRRRVKRVALAAACLLAIVVVAGASVEAVVRHRATQDHPPPGRLVDIGGRRLQLDCRGSGSPTIVLENRARGDSRCCAAGFRRGIPPMIIERGLGGIAGAARTGGDAPDTSMSSVSRRAAWLSGRCQGAVTLGVARDFPRCPHPQMRPEPPASPRRAHRFGTNPEGTRARR